MPTRRGGLPQVGEVWERTRKLPPDWEPQITRFIVLARGAGSYWSLRVFVPGTGPGTGRQLWVDPANAFRLGELKFIGEAGPETKRKLGLI